MSHSLTSQKYNIKQTGLKLSSELKLNANLITIKIFMTIAQNERTIKNKIICINKSVLQTLQERS
jgi:hypothetical protein